MIIKDLCDSHMGWGYYCYPTGDQVHVELSLNRHTQKFQKKKGQIHQIYKRAVDNPKGSLFDPLIETVT